MNMEFFLFLNCPKTPKVVHICSQLLSMRHSSNDNESTEAEN